VHRHNLAQLLEDVGPQKRFRRARSWMFLGLISRMVDEKEGLNLDVQTIGRLLVERFTSSLLRYHEAVFAVEMSVELPTGLPEVGDGVLDAMCALSKSIGRICTFLFSTMTRFQ
jgi:hypothetical protein